jgi:hypothetical protein
LLNTLQALHNAGRVHRDIRPDNLAFIVDVDSPADSKLLLLDWAFAGERNVAAPYSGATHFVSPRVADHLIGLARTRTAPAGPVLFCFTATDDVHSWLRLCVAMFNTVNVMAAFRYIDLNSPDLATKQRLIKAMMFDKELEAWTWVRLAAAVRELEARDRPEVGVKPQPVDYSHLHAFIPLRQRLVHALK